MTLTLKPETEARLLAVARRGPPAEAVMDVLLTEYEEAQELDRIADSPTPEELVKTNP